jgi:hypothetical protein
MENSISGRMNFDIAAKLFANAFKMPVERVIDEFRLTQSRLRLEQPLVTTSTLYNFPVLVNIQNQAQAFNTEVRLNLQDSFIPTHVGIYVAAPSGSTDATFKLLTYLNPFIFTNAAAMGSLYNGSMKIMVNNIQYINNWPVMWHWTSPETQQTAAAGAGSPVDQYDGDEYSLKPMQPYLLLIGSQNIQINITVPVAPTAVDANSRFVLVFDGILAQNSTSVG